MQAALIGPAGQTILGPAGLINGGIQSNQYVMYDCWVSARHTVISYLKQGYYTITNIRFLLCKSSLMTVPFLMRM